MAAALTVGLVTTPFEDPDFKVNDGNGGIAMDLVMGAVAFGEALTPEYKSYMEQVKKNASIMAQEFVKLGYNIVSGGTDNHSMLLDLRNKGVTGKDAENTLVKADITVNKNMVPFDTESPFVTSGIRIGTPAITTRGVKENEIKTIVELIDKVLTNISNEEVIQNVRSQVNNLMKEYPLFKM